MVTTSPADATFDALDAVAGGTWWRELLTCSSSYPTIIREFVHGYCKRLTPSPRANLEDNKSSNNLSSSQIEYHATTDWINIKHKPVIYQITRQVAARAIDEGGCRIMVDAEVPNPWFVVNVTESMDHRFDSLRDMPCQRFAADMDWIAGIEVSGHIHGAPESSLSGTRKLAFRRPIQNWSSTEKRSYQSRWKPFQ